MENKPKMAQCYCCCRMFDLVLFITPERHGRVFCSWMCRKVYDEWVREARGRMPWYRYALMKLFEKWMDEVMPSKPQLERK